MKRLITGVLKTGLILLVAFMVSLSYFAIQEVKNLQIYSILYANQVNELNVERNELLENSVETIKASSETVVQEVKPTYDYLKSVTVRMINFLDETMEKGSVGTGSIVKVSDDYTYILTNKHVAPIESNLVYVEKDSVRYKGTVLKNGTFRDLSLVRIVGKIPDTSVVKGFKKCKEQDKIYSVGMYLGEYDIYSEGTVAGWKGDSRLMNLPCLNGCSGSGVFDKDGNMVAVLFAGTAYNMFGFDTAKAICVPYIGIRAFLEEIL